MIATRLRYWFGMLALLHAGMVVLFAWTGLWFSWGWSVFYVALTNSAFCAIVSGGADMYVLAKRGPVNTEGSGLVEDD